MLSLVSFAFPKDKEKIKMFVRYLRLNSPEVKDFGFNWLPLADESGLLVCEIVRKAQLYQAAKYIWLAHQGYLGRRITPNIIAEGN